MSGAETVGFPEVLPETPEDPSPSAGLVMNPTIHAQLRHRTIRSFTEEPLGEDVVATLLDVARHAPTSGFYQQCTVLRIKDQQIRDVVYRSSGQPYVGGNRGELFIFVVDASRAARIRRSAGADLKPLQSTGFFLQGVDDVLIAAQNVVVAAESLGLGTCFLGSIGGDPESLIEALKLPKYTYPFVGLLVGHPNQRPQYRPRLPRSVTTAIDTYPDVESEEYRGAWEEYDQAIQTYYDFREGGKRQDSFTEQLIIKPGKGKAEKSDVLRILRDQGLCLY